jgi:hypothetical protein
MNLHLHYLSIVVPPIYIQKRLNSEGNCYLTGVRYPSAHEQSLWGNTEFFDELKFRMLRSSLWMRRTLFKMTFTATDEFLYFLLNASKKKKKYYKDG